MARWPSALPMELCTKTHRQYGSWPKGHGYHTGQDVAVEYAMENTAWAAFMLWAAVLAMDNSSCDGPYFIS